MKKIGYTPAMLGAIALLSACTATPDCLKSKDYADAKSFPALKAPSGLSVPESDSQMTIPDVRNGPVSAYAEAPAGTDPDNPQSRCLTTPPPPPDAAGAAS